jgi:hypothetical protein
MVAEKIVSVVAIVTVMMIVHVADAVAAVAVVAVVAAVVAAAVAEMAAAAVAEMAAAGVTATESSAPERSLVNQIGWDSKPVDHVHSRPTRDIASAFFCSDRFCSNALILRSFGHRSV